VGDARGRGVRLRESLAGQSLANGGCIDFNEGRRAQKSQEIIDIVQRTLRAHTPSADEATAPTRIVSQFAEITAPEAPPTSFIRVYEGGDGGGRSTKPGNVHLNTTV
jgi:hypothetical protein